MVVLGFADFLSTIMVITDRLRPRYELTLSIDATIARLPSYNIAIIFFFFKHPSYLPVYSTQMNPKHTLFDLE